MSISTPTEANPFPPRMTEDQFLHVVIRMAQVAGWMVFHPLPALNSRGRWATYQNEGGKGYPDLTLARNGEILFRELKSNTGRLSPEQEAWGEALGERWDVWRPQDYQAIKAALAR